MRAEEGLAALADDDFSPVFLRNATAYGASPRLRLDVVLNNLVGWALTTGKVRILSDGTPWRPIVHIEDIARAAAAAARGAARGRPRRRRSTSARDAENYQVRDLAEIVRETVPGSETEYARRRRSRPAQLPRRLRQARAAAARADARVDGARRRRASSTTPTARPASPSRSSRARASRGSSACSSSASEGALDDDLRWRGMRFTELELPGAYVIELDRIEDERGFFARTFCRAASSHEHGLATEIVQANTAFNRRAGHAARDALPGRAARGDETRPLHARRGLRRDRRPAARLGLVPRWVASSSRPRTTRCSTCRRASRTATRRSRTTPRPRT